MSFDAGVSSTSSGIAGWRMGADGSSACTTSLTSSAMTSSLGSSKPTSPRSSVFGTSISSRTGTSMTWSSADPTSTGGSTCTGSSSGAADSTAVETGGGGGGVEGDGSVTMTGLGGILGTGSGDRSCDMLVRLGGTGRDDGLFCWSEGTDAGGDWGGGGTLGAGSLEVKGSGVWGCPLLKLPVRRRRLLGGSPSCEGRGPRGIMASELTRVSKRGEGSIGLFCSTGEWEGCNDGGLRFRTGLREVFRGGSATSVGGGGCSPLILRLSCVAACTSTSNPPRPPKPPGLPRGPIPATGECDGSAFSKFGRAAMDVERGVIAATSD